MGVGLQKQVISIPFGQGIDTKSESKIVKPPKVIALENARFVAGETINKRFGTSAIGPSGDGTLELAKLFQVPSGGLLGVTARRNVSSGDEALVRFDANKNIWETATVGGTQNQRFHQSCTVAVNDIVRNQNSQNTFDSVTLGNYTYYAWEENGNIFLSVVDRTTGLVILEPTQESSSGIAVRLLLVGNIVLIGYINTSDSSIHVFSVGSTYSLTSIATVSVSGGGINPNVWDWGSVGSNNFCLAAGQSSPAQISVQVLSASNGSVVASTTIADTANNALAVAVPLSASDPIRIFWHSNSNGLMAIVYGQSLTITTAAYVLDSSLSPVVQNIAAINAPNQAGFFWCFAEVHNATSYNTSIKIFRYATDGVVSPSSLIFRSVGLASKPVMRSTGIPSILTVYDSSVQATYFLIDIAGDLATGIPENRAMILGSVAGGLTSSMAPALTKRSNLPNLMFVDSKNTLISCVAGRKNKIVSTGAAAAIYTLIGISELVFAFTASIDDFANKSTASSFNGIMMMCGGQLASYDGVFLLENGFFVYPETPSAVAALSGGFLSDGTYSFAATYEYFDYKGNQVESSPSVIGTVTISGGGGSGKITFTVPTYRIGIGKVSRLGVNAPRTVSVVVWMSDANLPNTLYRATDSVSLTINDDTVDSLSIIIALSNASLVAKQQLYTANGAVAANFTPDGPSMMFVYGKNLIIDDPKDPTILRYSKLELNGYGPHFASSFTIPIFYDGGRPIAGVAIDGQAIVFKKRSIWTFYGQGLDNTGAGQGFSIPLRRHDDIGCIGPQLLCEIPHGILFSSQKGIWLLTRNMQTIYAGAAVENYNSLVIRSFVHVKDNNEVRILLNDGNTTLVYNYYWTDDRGVGQWWIYSNYGGNCAIVDSLGIYTFAHSTGNGFAYAYKESVGAFVDNHILGAPGIVLKIITAWHKFASLQGFQRVRRAAILGANVSAHSLLVEAAYDYEGSFNEPHTIQSINAAIASSAYQPWVRFARPRNEAIQLRISDPSPTGESLTLTGIDWEVGLKGGMMRLPLIKAG